MDPAFSVVARDGGFRLYELSQPGVRTWTSCGATFLGDASAALTAVNAPDYRVDRLYVEGPPVGRQEVGTCGTAAVRRDEPDQVQVKVTMSREGWLVLADSWDPGWAARVGSHAAEIRHADYFFRAVRVPAGTHTVTFDYAPKSFRWGALISLASLAGGVLGLGLCLRMDRTRRNPGAAHA